METIEAPVLVVGAGGSGLTASIVLADLGVPAVTVERHEGVSPFPKAHYVNQRSMEIFRLHNVANDIHAISAPRESNGRIVWMTSLGGDGPLDGVRFASHDVMGGGDAAATYALKGATASTHLSQVQLESVLRRVAEARSPGRVLFGHEVVDLSQDDDDVTAVVQPVAGSDPFAVRARYVIGADAGRTVAPSCGITVTVSPHAADYTSCWFSADLSKYMHEDDVVMRMFIHPGRRNLSRYTGALITYGPDQWDGHSEQWSCGWAKDPDGEIIDDSNVVERLQDFLKIDVPITVHQLSHWHLELAMADTFRDRRVLLIGDAAHRQTPAGGLGLNTGIQDAHNLAWKLKLVLDGAAPDSLLDSFETERRPVAAQNVEWSMTTINNHALVMAAMGIVPGAPPEQNEAAFSRLVEPTFEGESRRAVLADVFKTQRMEYTAHDREMGFTYPEGAVVDDGSPAAWRDPMGAEYRPTTRPGSRLPHAWLHRDGQRVSTHDLLPLGGFLVLAAEDGFAWASAAAKVAADTGITLRFARIADDGDASDPSGAWAELRQHDAHGAVLVRPDGHVGWRASAAVDDPYETLHAALDRILDGG